MHGETVKYTGVDSMCNVFFWGGGGGEKWKLLSKRTTTRLWIIRMELITLWT